MEKGSCILFDGNEKYINNLGEDIIPKGEDMILSRKIHKN